MMLRLSSTIIRKLNCSNKSQQQPQCEFPKLLCRYCRSAQFFLLIVILLLLSLYDTSTSTEFYATGFVAVDRTISTPRIYPETKSIGYGDTIRTGMFVDNPTEVFYPTTMKAERNAQRSKAQFFVDELMSREYEDINNSNDGMKILRNIPMLETGEISSIVVRSETQQFWQACIDKVNTPDRRYRVAAVGTPGIGKTTNTPILIRTLLEEKKTVVYLIRTNWLSGWYYEFTPQANDERKTVIAQVYEESTFKRNIDSLEKRDTYYIVDPAHTKDDCNPASDFVPKFILVTSPHDSHWGDRQFTKERGNVDGFFKAYPIWSLEDLLLIRQEFGDFTKDDIRERYRMFGGIPRLVFTHHVKENLDSQDRAILNLSLEHVQSIALGTMNAIGEFEPNIAKFLVLALDPENNTDFCMRSNGARLLSPLIQEKHKGALEFNDP